MFLEFSVNNFLSFNRKTTLSMIPKQKDDKNIIEVDGIKLLQFASIYGEHKSGKSNLVKALEAIRFISHYGLTEEFRELYAHHNDSNRTKTTTFSQTFFLFGKVYKFRFSAILSKVKIVSESLVEIDIKTNTEKSIYNYNPGELIFENVFNVVKLSSSKKAKINQILQKKSKQPNKLLITHLIKNSSLVKDSKLEFLLDFNLWFGVFLSINTIFEPIGELSYLGSDDTREHATSLLNELNTNICEISVKKIDLKQFIDEYDEYGEDDVFDLLKMISDEYYLYKKDKPESAGVSVTLRDDDYYKVRMYHDDQFEVETIEIKECDSNQVYHYYDLSKSTQQLMNLLDIIFSQSCYGVYVIDEPLLALSPDIAKKLFEILRRELKNKNIQVIFTNEELNIVTTQIFRKDEMWILRRDEFESSHLSLLNYNDNELSITDSIKSAYEKSRHLPLKLDM